MDDRDQDCPNLTSRYEWIETVRRVRFGPRSKTREIAILLCLYGNKDGTRNFPGIARLAAVAECSERTVRDALDYLRWLGLLERAAEGSKHGRPRKGTKPRNDEYRLTIPPDLADRVDILPPDEVDQGREERRREERRADNDRRRAKRQAAAAALAANPSPKGSEVGSHPNSRELAEGSASSYQGKVGGVTGESYDRNRGKLRPDIPEPTSGNTAYPSIGPSHRPIHVADHSDSVNPPDARAPGAKDPERQDQPPARDEIGDEAKVATIGAVLGGLKPTEAERARELFAQGHGFREVYAVLAADRPPEEQRRRSGWGAA